MNNETPLKLFSKSESARQLGIGKTKLQELIDTDQIKITMLLGKQRISMKELQRFIEDNTMSQSEITAKQNTYKEINKLKSINSETKLKRKQNKDLDIDSIFNNIKDEVSNGNC